MSRALLSLTPIDGIALAGSMRCGAWIQAIMLSGVLGKRPAINARRPMPLSGGPTWRADPTTPGMVWQPWHPC